MKMTKEMMALGAALLLGTAVGVFRARVGVDGPFGTYELLLGVGGVLLALAGGALGKARAPEVQQMGSRFRTVLTLSGYVALIGTALMVLPLVGGTMDILTGCALALLFVAGLGIVLGLQRQDSEVQAVLSTVPVFAMGVFLLAVYKKYVAACPDVHRYALEILTVAALTLALYEVSSMRFLDRSRSFLISAGVLEAVYLTSVLTVSGLLRSGFIFSVPHLLVCAAFALNCAAWYLNPPARYTPPAGAEGGDEAEEADEETDGEE